MNRKTIFASSAPLAIIAAAFAMLSLPGCSVLSCDDYMTYSDILDSWVGHDLNDYERRNERRPYSSMERPRNILQYGYDTPYYGYDGTRYSCRTWFDVDRRSGEIVNWRYEGDCYMHGRCIG